MSGKDIILEGKTALGIEFGSTRIKGVLIDYKGNVLATGTYDWENSLVDGIWTYELDEVEKGLQGCYASLKQNVQEQGDKYGAVETSLPPMALFLSLILMWKNNAKAFINWALSNGYSDDLTIERIDVNGNYEPSNCTWVNLSLQTINKTTSHYFKHFDKVYSLKDLVNVFNLSYKYLHNYFISKIRYL